MMPLPATVLLMLGCLAMTQSSAQVDWSAALSGEVMGTDRQAGAYLVPTLALAYQGRHVDLSCAATSQLDGQQTEQLVASWQSQNSLNWRPDGSPLSGRLVFDHQQLDPPQHPAERRANDDLSGTLRLMVPQTMSLAHQLELTGRYRNRRSGNTLDNQLDEWSASGDYRLNWQHDARTQWRTGLTLLLSDRGTRSVQGSLGWQWQATRFSHAASLIGGRSEQDGQAVDSLGWNGVFSYRRGNLGWRLRGEHSQTDAISFFQAAGLDAPVTQQRQLLVDQLTVSVFGVQPVDSVSLTADFSVGRSRALFNLDLLDLDDQARQHFEQFRTDLTWQSSSATRVQLGWQRRLQQEVSRTQVTAELNRTLNRRWSLDGRLAQNVSGREKPLDWSVAIKYQF